MLKPGMQSVMNVQSGQLTVREVDVEPYVAWREGRFVFRAMTLDLIMRQLQRWYDFEVFYQNGTERLRIPGRDQKGYGSG